MALFIGLGTNIGNVFNNLENARVELSSFLGTGIYSPPEFSSPVDFIPQPDFLNQVGAFDVPKLSPLRLLDKLKRIEIKMGRKKIIPKGPRVIDLDIIIWGDLVFNHEHLTIPHPKWKNRPFVYKHIQYLHRQLYGEIKYDEFPTL